MNMGYEYCLVHHMPVIGNGKCGATYWSRILNILAT